MTRSQVKTEFGLAFLLFKALLSRCKKLYYDFKSIGRSSQVRIEFHLVHMSTQTLVCIHTLMLRLFVPFFKTSGRGDVKKNYHLQKKMTKKIKKSSSFFSSRMELKNFFYILYRKVSNLLFSLCL